MYITLCVVVVAVALVVVVVVEKMRTKIKNIKSTAARLRDVQH